MKQSVSNFSKSFMWMVAGFGLNHLLGIPLVGNFVAGLFRSVASGTDKVANAVSDYVKYDDMDHAQQAVNVATSEGARIERFYHNGDGSVAVKWDTSQYQGQDLLATEMCVESVNYEGESICGNYDGFAELA